MFNPNHISENSIRHIILDSRTGKWEYTNREEKYLKPILQEDFQRYLDFIKIAENIFFSISPASILGYKYKAVIEIGSTNRAAFYFLSEEYSTNGNLYFGMYLIRCILAERDKPHAKLIFVTPYSNKEYTDLNFNSEEEIRKVLEDIVLD